MSKTRWLVLAVLALALIAMIAIPVVRENVVPGWWYYHRLSGRYYWIPD